MWDQGGVGVEVGVEVRSKFGVGARGGVRGNRQYYSFDPPISNPNVNSGFFKRNLPDG